MIAVESKDGAAKAPTPEPDEEEAEAAPARAPRRKTKGEPAPTESDDIYLSAHYACTHCGLSFEPPSPQLFSFNSPQGMCLSCDGLGEVYTFDPDRLIPDRSKSFKQGALELIGPWRDLGRWRRHIFAGVAETLEHQLGLEAGQILDTPWEDLDPAIAKQLLWGTGDLHITFTWRHGPSGNKYGGRFGGVIPEQLSKYRNSQSGMQRRQLEKYMRVVGCVACGGARLNDQARTVTLKTRHPRFAERPARSLTEVCA